MIESQWITAVCKFVQESNIDFLKAIYSERSCKKDFETILNTYFGVDAPKFMAKPDLIMVLEDYTSRFDDYFLMAVELKYFEPSSKLDKNLRGAFREIGQALRYHLVGFDAAVLWHAFAEGIEEETIISFSSLIGEVFEKLELPLIYFSTKIKSDNCSRVYKPLNLDLAGDLKWLIEWMCNMGFDARNPLLDGNIRDKEVIKRRKALKAALRVP